MNVPNYKYSGYTEEEIAAINAAARAAADAHALPDTSAPTTNIPEPPPIIGSDKLLEVVSHLLCGTKYTQPGQYLNHLIDLNTKGMKVPFRKFAELSTLSTFGGLLGRKYKTADRLSSALQQLLVAPTGSGKGEAFTFWPGQAARLTAIKPQTRPSNFYNGSAASAQGIHNKLQEIGTLISIRPDASGDLRIIAEPNGSTQTMLRDYYYELFDASAYGAPPMSPVASIAGTGRGEKPIYNATFSAMWSTTPAGFSRAYNHEVLSTGLGSRMLVTVHDAPAGDSVPDSEVKHEIPGETFEMFAGLLAEVETFDAQCINQEAALKAVRVPYTADAAALLLRIEAAVNNVRRGVDSKKLPQHYAVFARTSMQVKKIALISALVRNRFDCKISAEDVAYALHYVVNALGSLAAMFDRGAVGGGDDRARQSAVTGWLRDFATSNDCRITNEMRKTMTVPLWWLNSRASRNNAFTQHRNGSSAALGATLGMMVSSGILELVEGRKAHSYRIIDLGIAD